MYLFNMFFSLIFIGPIKYFSFQTYIAVKSDGGFFLFPKRTQVGNCAFNMALPRNVMIDKAWEENIPVFKEMALKYLDTDKYGKKFLITRQASVI